MHINFEFLHMIFFLHISNLWYLWQISGMDRTGQDRTGQDRTGQDRTGQDRTEENRTEQNRTEQKARRNEGTKGWRRRKHMPDDPPNIIFQPIMLWCSHHSLCSNHFIWPFMDSHVPSVTVIYLHLWWSCLASIQLLVELTYAQAWTTPGLTQWALYIGLWWFIKNTTTFIMSLSTSILSSS